MNSTQLRALEPLQTIKTGTDLKKKNEHISRINTSRGLFSPFEVAAHELQRVVVWRRHVEHQTLQAIDFVHIV